MNTLDMLIARTQRNLTFVYCLLIAICLASFLFLPKPIDDSTKSLLTIVITALLALAQQSGSFWFARSRAAGVPNPPPTPTDSNGDPIP